VIDEWEDATRRMTDVAIIVQKYGGTSVEGREKVLHVAERVAALRKRGHDVVAVVSAQGSTTDALLDQARQLTDAPSQRELDMLMTAGERISMSLLAIALNSLGCPAVSFTGSQVGIITDTRHTDARILEVRPQRVITELRKGNVVVVGGFQGVSTEKDVTTLGRGGSDTTAVALAAALAADRCEILTDVDGVYTADPRTVVDARKIDELSYDDMAELSRFGATVLHEAAVRFAQRHGITIHVAGSESAVPGTIILESAPGAEPPITGLSSAPGMILISGSPGGRQYALGGIVGSEVSIRAAATVLDAFAAIVEASGSEGRGRYVGDGAAEVPVDLISIVGREAGSAQTLSEVDAALRELGGDALASVSAGRLTLTAVEPGLADPLVACLHSVFFPEPSAG
jgi:aspartate kinase